ncbi:MAG: glycosyltransferase family 4 protein, partial [Patescibacteria group bacterium]
SLELDKLGWRVTVLTPRHKRRDMKLHNFQIRGVESWFTSGNASFLPQLLWKLRHFKIVHLHYPFFGGAGPTAIWKRYLAGERKLVISYQMDVVSSGLKGRFFRWHTKYIMPWILRSADRVIVTSMDYAQAGNVAPVLAAHPEKFVEIPLGANTAIYHPQPRDVSLLTKHNIPPDDKVLIFVAALDEPHYFKGLDRLLEAVSRLTVPTTLIVVGRGPLKSTYEQLAAELGIADRVRFVGYVSDFDLARYHSIADVFVLPSIDKSEAFGLVYVEAMACGKPTIGSRLAGVRTVIDDGVTGLLVDPGNVDDLTDKINTLINDDVLAKKMGAAGLAKVLDRYTWKKVAKQLDDLYRSL